MDCCGSSIVMDFIRALPTDNGDDCILSITDCLRADVHIVPTNSNITAEDLTITFFDNWYCENKLPDDIVCNHNKLFIS